MKSRRIQFTYYDNSECMLDSEWKGCCCKCVHHFQVNKHCCSSPRGKGCVCGESLGFWVCATFAHQGDGDQANLSGEHGMCEMFIKRDETIS